MRHCCEDVVRYGDSPCPTNIKPRHVTVILNPAAKKRLAYIYCNTSCEVEVSLNYLSFVLLFSGKPENYLKSTANLYYI